MEKITQNRVWELIFYGKVQITTLKGKALIVEFQTPAGTNLKVPGFWNGGKEWRVRYASDIIGVHTYTTLFSDPAESSLNHQTGAIEIVASEGSNALLKHGHLRVSIDKFHLEHMDGKPFFWLGDTWWMGLTARLQWPNEFQWLVEDRKKKGFTVVQIVMGLYPDMPPFDPRGKNESGFPWQENFAEINPAYFAAADRRIQALVDAGIVPCLVGFWGYYLQFIGFEKLQKHWEYLIARYSAYPVVWCVCGEALMNYYLPLPKENLHHAMSKTQKMEEWSRLIKVIHASDPYQNPITIHPTQYGHEQISHPHLLDINMLQTGHANPTTEIPIIQSTCKMIARARSVLTPVVVGEVCYEGIFEANHAPIQRCLFWVSFLSGACGFTYGANGLWQVNQEDTPFGPSPTGAAWGNCPWKQAANLPGSRDVGLSKQILEQFFWPGMIPHPEWVNQSLTFAAGISNHLRIVYSLLAHSIAVCALESGIHYHAKWIDPKTGKQIDLGTIQCDKKKQWRSPSPPVFQDWLLILEA